MIGGIQALVWQIIGFCMASYQSYWHETDLMGDFFSTDHPEFNHKTDDDSKGKIDFDESVDSVKKEL
jgi:hypothetical protein